MTTDLSAFLLARVAEDEAAARAFIGEGPWQEWAARDMSGPTRDDEYAQLTIGAGRVLAQCAALREVVELHVELYWFSGARGNEATGKCRMCAENEESDYDGAPLVAWPCPTLRALARPYAAHPDYRPEEWA